MRRSIFIILFCIALLVSSSSLFAFPTTEQMKANYKMCLANDSGWYSRWGRFVVTFELNAAARACNNVYLGHGIPKLAGCRFEGSWHYAGYYCEEALR